MTDYEFTVVANDTQNWIAGATVTISSNTETTSAITNYVGYAQLTLNTTPTYWSVEYPLYITREGTSVSTNQQVWMWPETQPEPPAYSGFHFMMLPFPFLFFPLLALRKRLIKAYIHEKLHPIL